MPSILYNNVSNGAEAKAVHQRIQLAAPLAVGALPVVIALVVGQIVHGVDGADGITLHLIHGPVDGGNAGHLAAVVAHGFDALVGGKAGGHRSHQHQHMLVADHGLDIVPEDDLGVGIVLRLQNIDGLMLIDGAEAGLGQLLGNAGAQNSGAVQAKDGIHGGIINKVGDQLVCAVLRFTQACLLIGNINIVIDMRVIGREVAPGDAQGDIAMADRKIHQFDHLRYLRKYFFFKKRKSVFQPGEAFFAGL